MLSMLRSTPVTSGLMSQRRGRYPTVGTHMVSTSTSLSRANASSCSSSVTAALAAATAVGYSGKVSGALTGLSTIR